MSSNIKVIHTFACQSSFFSFLVSLLVTNTADHHYLGHERKGDIIPMTAAQKLKALIRADRTITFLSLPTSFHSLVEHQCSPIPLIIGLMWSSPRQHILKRKSSLPKSFHVLCLIDPQKNHGSITAYAFLLHPADLKVCSKGHNSSSHIKTI